MPPIPPRPLGQYRHVRFVAAQIAIESPVDLLIVGMQEKDGGRSGAEQVDRALHGTLGRLRAGGIFTGMAGEELTLWAPPAPIGARSLMLIGLGAGLAGDPLRIGRLTRQAMRSTLCTHARKVACLLGWNGLDIAEEGIEEIAAAMMRGALLALDGLETPPRPIEWIFDIRNGQAQRTAAALENALATWHPPE